MLSSPFDFGVRLQSVRVQKTKGALCVESSEALLIGLVRIEPYRILNTNPCYFWTRSGYDRVGRSEPDRILDTNPWYFCTQSGNDWVGSE